MAELIYNAAWEELLPNSLRSDDPIFAMTKAIAEQKRKISSELWKVRIWEMIEQMPESTLDALAYDLNVKWYRGDYDLEAKRTLLKNVFRDYKALGTKKAVENNITAVFGEGKVVEWFEFDEGDRTPGMFDIVSNALLTENNLKEFQDVIQWSKNARSHIRRVLASRGYLAQEYAAQVAATRPSIKILSGTASTAGKRHTEYLAVAVVSVDKHIVIRN